MFLFVFRNVNDLSEEVQIVALTQQEARIRLSGHLKKLGRDEKMFALRSSREIRASLIVASSFGLQSAT